MKKEKQNVIVNNEQELDALVFKLITFQVNNLNDFWEHVDLILNFVYTFFPEEMREAAERAYTQKIMISSKTKSTKSKSARLLAVIPARVMQILELIYGHKLQHSLYKNFEQFVIGFAKRYPEFSVPDTNNI